MKEYNDFRWPEVFRTYNSERREQAGVSQYRDLEQGDAVFFNMPAGAVQTFLLDGTDTDYNNPKTVTLYTYANGVKLDMTYYVTDDGNTLGVNITQLKTYRGDNIVSAYDYGAGLNRVNITKQNGSTMSAVRFLYAPSYINYGRNEELGPYGGMSFGGCVFAENVITEPPYGWPSLVGQQNFGPSFPESQYGRAYTVSTFPPFVLSPEDYDEYFEKLVDAGDGTPISPILPSDDTSDPGGGDEADPDYDPFSDPVDFPDLPTGGDALSSGFIRAYTPTASQLQSIARKLWSDDFVDTIKKIQNDPMEAIISLHSVPFSVAAGNANCVIGNYDTGITVPIVGGQFIRRNLGSIYIPEHWASALDYSPYVTVDIFLPYVGVRSLQVDDIIKRTISVEYLIDVLTGAAVCHIKCGNSVLYTYNCNMAMNIPLSMSSMAPLMQAIMGSTANILNGAVSGGIGGAVGGALGSAINVATSKHSQISRGSSLGGSFGCLSNFVPYLIIHRPIQSLASGFAHFKGYPSNITATIGSVSGYSEVESVHLTGIPCTDIERDEINALLYNGVIV